MGKRQTRILSKDISRQLPILLNQEANILLNNGVVLHGLLTGNDNYTLIIQDMLRKKQTIPFTSIAEIIVDRETDY